MPMTQNLADLDMGANLISDKLRKQQQLTNIRYRSTVIKLHIFFLLRYQSEPDIHAWFYSIEHAQIQLLQLFVALFAIIYTYVF